jgi:hypothetical protein
MPTLLIFQLQRFADARQWKYRNDKKGHLPAEYESDNNAATDRYECGNDTT